MTVAASTDNQPLWIILSLASIPALAAITAAILAGLFARSSKRSETEAQRLRDLESRISERKYDTYKPMIDLLGDMLNKEKSAAILASGDVPARLHEFANWASIYASDESVRSFRNLMQASYTGAPPEMFLRLYAEFVIAARQDIGRSDTTTSLEEIISIRLTDFYAEDGLRWVVVEPFDDVCKRTGWVPPWQPTR